MSGDHFSRILRYIAGNLHVPDETSCFSWEIAIFLYKFNRPTAWGLLLTSSLRGKIWLQNRCEFENSLGCLFGAIRAPAWKLFLPLSHHTPTSITSLCEKSSVKLKSPVPVSLIYFKKKSGLWITFPFFACFFALILNNRKILLFACFSHIKQFSNIDSPLCSWKWPILNRVHIVYFENLWYMCRCIYYS